MICFGWLGRESSWCWETNPKLGWCLIWQNQSQSCWVFFPIESFHIMFFCHLILFWSPALFFQFNFFYITLSWFKVELGNLFQLAWYRILTVSRNKSNTWFIFDLTKSNSILLILFIIESFYGQCNELMVKFAIEKNFKEIEIK